MGQWASRSTGIETTTTLGAEEGVCVEEEEETDALRGNRACPDVNPLGVDAALLPATAAAAEAGRLRRRAAAALQNKVWDPKTSHFNLLVRRTSNPTLCL